MTWLTRAEAATHARRSPATIDRWARIVPHIKTNRGLVDAELLDAFITDGRPGVLRIVRNRRKSAA